MELDLWLNSEDGEAPVAPAEAPAANVDPPEETEEATTDIIYPPEVKEDTPAETVTVTRTEEEGISSDSDGSTSRSRISSSESESNDSIINTNYGVLCPLCELKCDTMHELNEHKKIHSYANMAKSPPRASFSASQPTTSSHNENNSDSLHKKRGASTSPSSENMQRKKANWTKISDNQALYKL